VAHCFPVVLFGLVVRAGHDALMWFFEAHQALREKREFESKGLSAAIQWAQEKEIAGAQKGIYKGDAEKVVRIVQALEEKYGKA
jgi:hypothetical protein